MKYKCELMQDLIPLYHDKALSDYSIKIVEEHLQVCPDCINFFKEIENDAEQSLDSNQGVQSSDVVTFSKRVGKVRKIVIAAFLVMILLLSVSTGFLIYLKSNEIHSYTFASYSDAQDIIQHGWIPSSTPNTATGIYVTYDIDTNIINGSFNLQESAISSFIYSYDIASPSQFSDLPKGINPEWNRYKELIYRGDASIANYTILQSDTFLFALSDTGYVLFWSK